MRITVVARIKIRDEQFVPYHWTHVRTYTLWPILNPTVDEVISRWYKKEFRSCLISEAPYSREEARKDFWRLQGDILGTMATFHDVPGYFDGH